MTGNQFENWQKLQDPDLSEDELLSALKEHEITLKDSGKNDFLNDLFSSGIAGNELALEALKELANSEQQSQIAEETKKLLAQEPEVEEAFKLPYFIRILLSASAKEKTYEPIINKYFVEYPMATWWDIPNQLYDYSQSLFLKAYTRYLETLSKNDVVHFHSITRLLYAPNALRLLAKNLPPD